jgi:hypothetical protein
LSGRTSGAGDVSRDRLDHHHGRPPWPDLNCLTLVCPGGADDSAEAATTARHYGHAFHRMSTVLEAGRRRPFFRAMQQLSVDGLNTYLVNEVSV